MSNVKSVILLISVTRDLASVLETRGGGVSMNTEDLVYAKTNDVTARYLECGTLGRT